jgi:hypothetical protein
LSVGRFGYALTCFGKAFPSPGKKVKVGWRLKLYPQVCFCPLCLMWVLFPRCVEGNEARFSGLFLEVLKMNVDYGCVVGLDVDELLDVLELERMARLACRSMSEPLELKLPWRVVDFWDGAFDTWDFLEKCDFDKRVWKIRSLRKELDELRLRADVIRRSLKSSLAVRQVLDYVRNGVLCSRLIVDEQLRGYVELMLRIDALREELKEVGM